MRTCTVVLAIPGRERPGATWIDPDEPSVRPGQESAPRTGRRQRVPRSEARIFTSIWDDEDFLALPGSAQRLYMFLTSQKDLTHCGVIPLRPGRWARKAKGLTVTQIEADLELLAAGLRPFVIVDEDTGELLVRSLVRHDGVWKIPNIMKSARESAALVESRAILAALLRELLRIPAQDSESAHVRKAHAEFVDELRDRCGNPSPNPSGNGSRNPSANPSASPSVDPSQGKGEGYGPVLQVSPNPKSPSPPPRAPAGELQRQLWPAAVPDPKPGEEEISTPGETRDIPALVASLREIRPEWSSASIKRVLADPSITERPWELVWAAAHLVAEDRETKQIGRLLHDGPWWAKAAAGLRVFASRDRPPWCGECDQLTRQIIPSATSGLVIGDDRPIRCHTCHPSLRKEPA